MDISHHGILTQFTYTNGVWRNGRNLIPPTPYPNTTLVIIDGTLTAVGGWGGSHTTNKLFTLEDQWIEKYPPMNTARSYTAAVSTSDGNYVIVIGGSSLHWIDTVEMFHVRGRRWYELTNLPKAPSAIIWGNHLQVMGENGDGFSCFLHALPSCNQPITSQSIWTPLPQQPVICSATSTLCGRWWTARLVTSQFHLPVSRWRVDRNWLYVQKQEFRLSRYSITKKDDGSWGTGRRKYCRRMCCCVVVHVGVTQSLNML